jgi:hypothetical protein
LPRDEKAESIGYLREILNSKQVLGGKHVGKERVKGCIVWLSKRSCKIELNELVPLLTNLKMNLGDVDEGVGGQGFLWKGD